MKIALCILTRNEINCVKQTLPQILNLGQDSGFDELYAIDGGSTDGTVEFFQKHGVRIVAQSQRGRGDAFLQAFQKIESDAYIFFSPDGNENIADLKKFRPLLENGAELVIASRMMRGAVNEEDAHFFRWRKWANLAFNILTNISFRRSEKYVTDSINGYRAITRKKALELKLDALDYTIEYQMTMRAMKKKLNIVEFPTIEGQRISGETQAKSIPTGIRFLKCFFNELFSTSNNV